MFELPISEKELEVIKKLREKVVDLNLENEQNSDAFLVRWLRARDLDVDKAEEMLRKSLKWRIENKIDTILEDWIPPEIYYKMYPSEICGYTKDGIPVLVMPSRFMNVDLFWELDKDEYIKFCLFQIEKAIKHMQKGRPRDSPLYAFIGLYDIGEFNIKTILNRKYFNFMKEQTKVFDENYPELVHKAYFLFAPKIFSMIFAMFKPIMPKRTVTKFQILGSDVEKMRECLVQEIPIEILPGRYGGQNIQFDETAFKNCGTGSITRKASISGDSFEIDGYLEYNIPAGKKQSFDYDINELNTLIKWSFKTANYDIGFMLTFQSISENDKNEIETIVELSRVESQISKQTGEHLCSKIGKYTLTFDNSFSRLRSKTLYLKLSINNQENQ